MLATFTCRTCGRTGKGKTVAAKEMMFGSRESFEYRECPDCGCVQIAEYPKDVAQYYPADYYSLGVVAEGRRSGLQTWIRNHRARRALGKFDVIGLGHIALHGLPEYYRWLKPAKVDFDSRILDIGCGEGRMLAFLRDDGFRALRGVDPHAGESARHQPGFEIERRLEDVQGTFDFVLLSHSLEHMPDQPAVFRQLRRVSHATTTVCIRIPIATRAWQQYGVDWVQLDAPRHFYLHTPRSLEVLASAAGFRVRQMVCDSDAFQFWGSEQYRAGIALHDPRSYAKDRAAAPFTPTQIADWKRQAHALNQARLGDQAVFYLEVAGSNPERNAPLGAPPSHAQL